VKSSEGSITAWLGEIKAGKRAAAQKIWERYVGRLVKLARSKLGGSPRGAADEEDVAQAAFNSFFAGVETGRFPRLDDRDDLWRVLVMLTERKAIDQMRRESRQPTAARGATAAAGDTDALRQRGTPMELSAREPTPEFAVQVAEEYARLLGSLEEGPFRQLAALKMEGFTNEEIAARLDCSLRTVERRLGMIRRRWQEQGRAGNDE
jgi:RNA polymerase sigma factor (sigma-70 family)